MPSDFDKCKICHLPVQRLERRETSQGVYYITVCEVGHLDMVWAEQTLSSHIAYACNVLGVQVGMKDLNGDSGDTIFELTDHSGTCWDVTWVAHPKGGIKSLKLVFHGTSEHDTFVECLEFAIKKLQR